MNITSIKGAPVDEVQIKIAAELHRLGYSTNIKPKTMTSFSISDIRLSPESVAKDGYNYKMGSYLMGFAKSPRRTTELTWDDWVNVNDAINRILDSMGVYANVSTLGGKFKIRKGKTAYTEMDWEHLLYENVGSQMRPVTREEAIISEDLLSQYDLPPKFMQKIGKIKIPSTNPKGWHMEPVNHALASKGIKVGKNRVKR